MMKVGASIVYEDNAAAILDGLITPFTINRLKREIRVRYWYNSETRREQHIEVEKLKNKRVRVTRLPND